MFRMGWKIGKKCISSNTIFCMSNENAKIEKYTIIRYVWFLTVVDCYKGYDDVTDWHIRARLLLEKACLDTIISGATLSSHKNFSFRLLNYLKWIHLLCSTAAAQMTLGCNQSNMDYNRNYQNPVAIIYPRSCRISVNANLNSFVYV